MFDLTYQSKLYRVRSSTHFTGYLHYSVSFKFKFESQVQLHLKGLSKHEWQVDVLNSIADVHGAIDGSVATVVPVVAWPQLTAKGGNTFGGILNNAPALVWFVT